MAKYRIWLSDSWKSEEPFMCPWDKNLIGQPLREEFSKAYEDEKKRQQVVTGGSKSVMEGEFLKKFMVRKQINLVDDPATGTLKSVFILKPKEKKLVDEQAWESLKRYARKVMKASDGTESSELGFLEHHKIGGDEDEKKPVQVEGKDVTYFDEEEKIEQEEPKTFECEICGKQFDTKRQLQGHNITCKKK